MNENGLIRNVFNNRLINKIANQLKEVYSDFESSKFVIKASNFDAETGFKERANIIAHALVDFLPKDFIKSAQIIKATLKEPQEKDISWGNFFYMPYSLFVEWQGCKKEYLVVSFDLLKEITKRFTSEFAIRPYIIDFPEQTISILKNWVTDENHHVRRLVSEGLRPRLPWAKSINSFKKDPYITLKILEFLKNDPSKYVQKSVANHMNDITKDNPDIALDVLARWKKENNANTNWIVKHALRNELKKGTPKALEIVGFSLSPKLKISNFKLSSNQINFGDNLRLKFTVENIGKSTVNLMIDYICHFMKSNGKTSPKIFKISSKKLQKGESFSVDKMQSFKLISTRKIYEGEHRIEIFVNGISFGELAFHLVA